MKITNNEYSQLADKHSPKSKIWLNVPKAFVIGGFICVIGQLLMELFSRNGMNEFESAALTSMTLIFLSALLTGLQLYDKIARHAGAGTLVPITGFANSVVAPAMEFKSEGHVAGLAAKMFIVAGPVIVYGITASVIYGIIVYAFKLA